MSTYAIEHGGRRYETDAPLLNMTGAESKRMLAEVGLKPRGQIVKPAAPINRRSKDAGQPRTSTIEIAPTKQGRDTLDQLRRENLIPAHAVVNNWNESTTINTCDNLDTLRMLEGQAITALQRIPVNGKHDDAIAEQSRVVVMFYERIAALLPVETPDEETATVSTPTLPRSIAPAVNVPSDPADFYPEIVTLRDTIAQLEALLLQANTELAAVRDDLTSARQQNEMIGQQLIDAHARLETMTEDAMILNQARLDARHATATTPHDVPSMSAYLTERGIQHTTKGTFSVWVFDVDSTSTVIGLEYLGFRWSAKRNGWYFNS